MHDSIIIKKLEDMTELFDVVHLAAADRPENKQFKYTKDRICSFTVLLKAYKDNEDEMTHSRRVEVIFESFYAIKEKFDAFLKDALQKSREWYTAALIVSEADKALEIDMLAAHTVRECLKKGMSPWLAACATNSVLEQDIATLKESTSAYDALVKSGKIK